MRVLIVGGVYEFEGWEQSSRGTNDGVPSEIYGQKPMVTGYRVKLPKSRKFHFVWLQMISPESA